jgi:hypothetical protein
MVLSPQAEVARSLCFLCHYDWKRERVNRLLWYFPGGIEVPVSGCGREGISSLNWLMPSQGSEEGLT